jgi:hypothetical protein
MTAAMPIASATMPPVLLSISVSKRSPMLSTTFRNLAESKNTICPDAMIVPGALIVKSIARVGVTSIRTIAVTTVIFIVAVPAQRC